ncbi:GNAT family N-acetyltransferase [Paenibacillus sp. CAU 1782]
MIRSFTSDDFNYIMESHVRIYHHEYQFDESFKSFISNAIHSFRENVDKEKEMVFILELDGRPKGSIGITRLSDDTAQLRWFLLETEARGKGWGGKLLEEALKFAEARQYKKITLWTNQKLTAARSLYERYGFSIVESKVEILSNQEMIEERWEYQF